MAAAGAKTIDISAAIVTAEGYDREKVKTNIEDILAGYFSDLAFRQYYISYAKIGAMILEAVSYTHLDVYKRQLRGKGNTRKSQKQGCVCGL